MSKNRFYASRKALLAIKTAKKAKRVQKPTKDALDKMPRLFKTEAERIVFFQNYLNGTVKIHAGTPWQHALTAGALADRHMLMEDIAAIAVLAIVDAHPEYAGEISREAVIESRTFVEQFDACRAANDIFFKGLLGQSSEDPWKNMNMPKDLKAKVWAKTLDVIAVEALEIDENNEFRDFDPEKGKIRSPNEAWNLQFMLTGKKIRYVSTLRDQKAFPGPGTKTFGTITKVTERRILVDWEDGRDFYLLHGVDTIKLG